MQQHPKVIANEEEFDPEPEPNHQNYTWVLPEENDDFIKPENTNKFISDPENGGGRRRRIHNVSRIEHLRGGEAGLRDCVKELFGNSGDNKTASISDDDENPF